MSEIDPGPSVSLRRRIGKASLWALLGSVGTQLLGAVKIVVLARLLEREQFGIVSIGLLAVTAFDAFTQTGFSIAIWQEKQPSERKVQTAWTIGLIRGLFLTLALIILAPFLGTFFHSPESVPIIRLMALGCTLSGMGSMGPIEYRRDLRWDRLIRVDIAVGTADAAGAIIGALILRNAYALVIGYLLRQAVGLLAFYRIHPWRPRWLLSLEDARSLFRFGRWVSGTVMLRFLGGQLDKLLVGRLLGVGDLGTYTMASSLANMLYSTIQGVVQAVGFSSYVEIGCDDRQRLSRAYERMLFVIAAIGLCAAVPCVLFGETIIPAILGVRWGPAVPVFSILVVAYVVRALCHDEASNVLTAIGQPAKQTLGFAVQLGAMILLVKPLFGMAHASGVAWAVLVSWAAAGIVLSVLLRRNVRYSGKLLRAFSLDVVLPVIMATAAAQTLRRLLPGSETWIAVAAMALWLATLGTACALLQWGLQRYHSSFSLRRVLL